MLPQFGEYDGVDDYTWRSLDNLLRGLPPGRLRQPAHWVVERLQWETEDDRARRREWAPTMKSVLPGAASGPVLPPTWRRWRACAAPSGGLTSPAVCSSSRFPTPRRSGRRTVPLPRSWASRSARLAGLCLGGVNPDTGIDVARVHRYAEELLKPLGVPLAVNVPFGHVDPMISLAQGGPRSWSAKPIVT